MNAKIENTSAHNDTAPTGQEAANDALLNAYRTAAGKVGKLADALEKAKGGVWGAVAGSLKIASEAGHTVENYVTGMTLACAEAEVPENTVRMYVGRAGKLYALVLAGTVTLADAVKMDYRTVLEKTKTARKPRQTTAKTDGKPDAGKDQPEAGEADTERSAALRELAEACATLDPASIRELAELARSMANNAETEQRRAA